MGFDKKEYQRRYMKQKRLEKRGLTPESNEVESNAGKSNTDEMFEALRPGYYIFGKDEREAMCFTCFRKFRTRLELLKFCSPKCQKEKLSTFTTVGITNEL